MVKRLIVCLALASASNSWALTAQLDRKSLALGEPLTLSLTGRAATLEQIDLAPLKRGFEIFGRTLSQGDGTGVLQLTLYPLKAGRLAIPSLGVGRDRSRALSVQVDTHSQTMPAVDIRLYTEPAQPRVRQPTRLTLELCDDGGLEWKRPALPLSSQMQHRPLGEEQLDLERDGVRCTAHRYHWAVLPTQAGELRLDLPMLEAGKFGQRLRLPPPAAAFSAAPAPGWLPLNVAMGKPTLDADALPAESPMERPLAWRFTVEGGYSVDGLKALLALQLQPYPQWRAYPPAVETLAPEDRNSPLTRLAVTLYALPEASGTLAMPALALPYFDPADGRLQQLALPARTLEIYDPFWRKLGLGTALTLGAAALLMLLQWLYRERQWRQERERALLAIGNAAGPDELGQALRGLAFTPGTQPAVTLGHWLERMTGQSRQPEGLVALVAALEARRYGLRYIPLAELQQQATALIAKLRPNSSLSWRQKS
jgi:hypothetical protein